MTQQNPEEKKEDSGFAKVMKFLFYLGLGGLFFGVVGGLAAGDGARVAQQMIAFGFWTILFGALYYFFKAK